MHSVGCHCPPGKSTPDRCWQNAHGGVGCADGATARLVYLAVGRPIPVARQIPDLALNHRLARGITPGDKTTPTGWLLLGSPPWPPRQVHRPSTTCGNGLQLPSHWPMGFAQRAGKPRSSSSCGKASNDCRIGRQDRRKLGPSIVPSWHCCHWANSCCCRSSGSIAAAAERPRNRRNSVTTAVTMTHRQPRLSSGLPASGLPASGLSPSGLPASALPVGKPF